MGQAQDIERSTFGTEREPIRQHLDLLTELQRGPCLYCQRSLSGEVAHVDHFVPWVLHRCEALTNLVAAHVKCSLAKADWLAAEPHIESWLRRNESLESDASRPDLAGTVPNRLGVTAIAKWTYNRAYALGLPT